MYPGKGTVVLIRPAQTFYERIKVTYGRVSRSGVVTLSWSQDHCGPMTWTVEDSALML